MGSVFYCIQHVNVCKNTDFQVHGTSSFLFVKGSPFEGWSKIPHSKNSFCGILWVASVINIQHVKMCKNTEF